MAISIEVNELSDPELRKETEKAIRSCIGDRHENEEWKVWIQSLGGACQVTVKGPDQKRERLFFDDISALPKTVREWLAAYPLR